jgi:PAS domain S-box-containing protein
MIFDAAEQPVDYRFLEVNPVFEKQTGVKDAVGKTVRELIPNLESHWFDRYGKVALTGEPIRFSEGSEVMGRWFDVYAYRIGGQDSRKVALLFTDITERNKVEQALRQSEERLQKVLSIETVGVIYFDLDGGIHDANPAFQRISGYSRDEFISNRVRWDKLTPPEFMEVTLKSREEFLTKWQNTPYEKQYIRPDGSRWWGLFAGKRLSDNECVEFVVDITEQKKAQEALRESESNLRNMIVNAPVAMCLLSGPSFVVELANDRIFEIWGKSPEEMLHKPVFESLPEAGKLGLEHEMQRVFTTGEPFIANELAVPLPRNGVLETTYLNFIYEAYRSGDGTITGIIAVANEVTDQVLARKKVEKSNQEFQFVTDFMPQMIWLTRPDGYHYYYNKQWYDYTGLTYGETEGEGWNNVFHPGDQLRALKVWRQSLDTGEPYQIEYRCRRYDGEYRWFLGRALPLRDESGAILKWFGTCTDIDDQKRASEIMEQKVEERTRELEAQKSLMTNILTNSSNGISVTEMVRDESGRVIDARTILANDAAVKFTGLPKDIYLSVKATELDPNIFSSPYGLTCMKTLQTGEPSLSQYYLDIAQKWLELTISKMDDDHLIHIFTDITPIKVAQLQLEKTVEELRRSNQNLEEFAYAASHDLKEPVRKVHFFSEKIRSTLHDRMTEGEKQSFERMELAAKRMGSLIDDLLSYSQISIRPRTFEAVNMNQLIDLVLQDLDLEIEDKGATITVDNLFTIQGHHRQLQQAFQNLISNSLKYRKTGIAPQIKIRCSRIRGNETGLRLSGEESQKIFYSITVQDNGIGFEQQDAERIFNVFTRLHGNAEFRGTGIGLSIVRKVVENHNGHIWAESTPGEGATFNVLLPAE